MGKFVGQKLAADRSVRPLGEIIARSAVFGTAMMFQPDPALPVAQGEEEIVVVVVLRAKKLHGLRYQVAVKLDLLVSGGELFRTVGDDIQFHAGSQSFSPDIRAGEDRAVYECVQRDSFVMDSCALLRGHFQRAGGLPFVGEF